MARWEAHHDRLVAETFYLGFDVNGGPCFA